MTTTSETKNEFSGFARKMDVGDIPTVEGRQLYSITITCKNETLRAVIAQRMFDFLESDDLFMNAVQDIMNDEILRGMRLDQFMVNERMAKSIAHAKSLIEGGMLRWKRPGVGGWRPVNNVNGLLQPGWWRKMPKGGLTKVGPDFIIEKRLNRAGTYVNWEAVKRNQVDEYPQFR